MIIGYGNILFVYLECYIVIDIWYLVYIYVSIWCKKYKGRLYK